MINVRKQATPLHVRVSAQALGAQRPRAAVRPGRFHGALLGDRGLFGLPKDLPVASEILPALLSEPGGPPGPLPSCSPLP